jgi:hypothetical protein
MLSSEMLDFRNLPTGSRIDLETSSRHYQIEIAAGGSVRISGHPEFCPDLTPAELRGSLSPQGILDGVIGKGMRLSLLLDHFRPMTTSRVLSIHVDPAKPAPLSASIH